MQTVQAQAQTAMGKATEAQASSSSVHSTQNNLQQRHGGADGIELSSSISATDSDSHVKSQ